MEGEKVFCHLCEREFTDDAEFLLHFDERQGLCGIHILAGGRYVDWSQELAAASRLQAVLSVRSNLVHLQCRNGLTPLSHAARRKNWQIVRVLLQMGANVDSKDNDGLSVFHHLAKADNWRLSDKVCTELIQMLLSLGADIDARDSSQRTPLQMAAMHNEWRTAQALINAGASVESVEPDGLTLFHHLALISVDLHPAVISATVPLMSKLLLKHGVDINRRAWTAEGDLQGDTPLNTAARVRDWRTVKVFVQHGADPSLVDRLGLSVLHRLVMASPHQQEHCFCLHQNISMFMPMRVDEVTKEAIFELLDNGFDINLPSPTGSTALDIVIKGQGPGALFWLLVSKGATIKPGAMSHRQKLVAISQLQHIAHLPLDEDIMTRALSSILEELPTLLCKQHVCTVKKDRSSNSPHSTKYCWQTHLSLHTEEKELLVELDKALIWAVQKRNLMLTRLLLDFGADPNTRTFRSNLNMLMSFVVTQGVCFCDPETVSFVDCLLDHGVGINDEDRSGTKALQHLIQTMRVCERCQSTHSIVTGMDHLIKRGADILTRDNRGKTPLWAAVFSDSQRPGTGDPRIVFYLLQTGAGVFQPQLTAQVNLDSMSSVPWYARKYAQSYSCPVITAVTFGHVKLVHALLESGACTNKTAFDLNRLLDSVSVVPADEDSQQEPLEKVFDQMQPLVRQAATTPRSLKSACRLTIWQALGCGRGRRKMVEEFGLPQILVEYLMFGDVMDGIVEP